MINPTKIKPIKLTLGTILAIVLLGFGYLIVSIIDVFSPTYTEFARIASPDGKLAACLGSKGGGATVAGIVVVNVFEKGDQPSPRNEVAQFYGSYENDVSVEWETNDKATIHVTCERVVSSRPDLEIGKGLARRNVNLTYSILERKRRG